MKYISVGDMSQTYLMRRHNTQLKQTMNQLSGELVTGVQKDLGAAVGGDFTALAAIDRSLARNAAFKQVAAETDLLAGTQQEALETVQGHATAIGATLVSAVSSSSPSMIDAGVQDALVRFSAIVNALNVSVAGRYALSGTSTDTAPVAQPEVILTALGTAIGGLTQPDDIVNAVETWFDQPYGSPGYLDTAYQGSATGLAPVQLSETDQTQVTLTAADPTIRNLLKGFALASLIAEKKVPDVLETRSALTQAAGERILTSDAELSVLRSELGTVESIVAESQTRNAAQKTALELAKGELVGADSYDTATALEAVQSQLETLYSLTSRLSQLTLTDYLR